MGVPRLLVLAPLRLEAMALGPSGNVGPAELAVQRAGMGLARAGVSARRLSAASGPPAAVAVAGLGGALRPDLVPGDVVVADRLVDDQGRQVARFASAPLLVAELRRDGLHARTGTVVSTDHMVTGRERATLAGLGADVVDMESTAVARASWGAPLAVLRAVSDSPGVELLSPAGALGALKGLHSLHRTRRALAYWAAAAGPRQILLAEPRSFCAGVERAIDTVERALVRFGPPIYVRRQIVHNAHVVSRLEVGRRRFCRGTGRSPRRRPRRLLRPRGGQHRQGRGETAPDVHHRCHLPLGEQGPQ